MKVSHDGFEIVVPDLVTLTIAYVKGSPQSYTLAADKIFVVRTLPHGVAETS